MKSLKLVQSDVCLQYCYTTIAKPRNSFQWFKLWGGFGVWKQFSGWWKVDRIRYHRQLHAWRKHTHIWVMSSCFPCEILSVAVVRMLLNDWLRRLTIGHEVWICEYWSVYVDMLTCSPENCCFQKLQKLHAFSTTFVMYNIYRILSTIGFSNPDYLSENLALWILWRWSLLKKNDAIVFCHRSLWCQHRGLKARSELLK